MRLRALISAMIAVLLMCCVGFAEPPGAPPIDVSQPLGSELSAAEKDQALSSARTFVEAMYSGNYEAAFAVVHGVSDAKVAALELRKALHDFVAREEFRKLNECTDNLSIIGAAIDTYAVDHRGQRPRDLSTVVKSREVYLKELPHCPAGGKYEYQYDARRNTYRLYCHKNAHAAIGVRGDYPEYVDKEGLSIGNQALNLAYSPHFALRSCSIKFERIVPDFHILIVRMDEVSDMDNEGFVKRSSHFAMSRKNGQWAIDLDLSNRDMAFVYDYERWTTDATIPKQLLYYYQLAQTPQLAGMEDSEDKAQLQVRICSYNLRDISVALESWSVAHGGRYPQRNAWKDLIPHYLTQMPKCPAGGIYHYVVDSTHGGYRVYCAGHAHRRAGLPDNFPEVDPVYGISKERQQ